MGCVWGGHECCVSVTVHALCACVRVRVLLGRNLSSRTLAPSPLRHFEEQSSFPQNQDAALPAPLVRPSVLPTASTSLSNTSHLSRERLALGALSTPLSDPFSGGFWLGATPGSPLVALGGFEPGLAVHPVPSGPWHTAGSSLPEAPPLPGDTAESRGSASPTTGHLEHRDGRPGAARTRRRVNGRWRETEGWAEASVSDPHSRAPGEPPRDGRRSVLWEGHPGEAGGLPRA